MSDLPGYLAYRAIAGVFSRLPEPAMRRSGEALGRLLWHLAPKRRALVQRHLRRVVGESADVVALSRRMFASYGRYWAELFWITPRRKAEFVEHADVEGVEHATAARDAGRGVIFALPHIGNWEAAGAKAEAIGFPVLAAAEALSNQRIVDWFVECRRAVGIDVVVASTGAKVTAALMRRLGDGGTVALVADRDVTGRGVEVEFFGEKTTMPAGPVALAERTGAALFPVGSYFKEGKGHDFVIHEPIVIPDAPTREERIAGGVKAFASALEGIIRVAPEQWHLFVPNWPSDEEPG
ncbi:MAG TPA: phosphatidylinositol mannoside acyltransferase [Acidimicrobiia bacterium]